MSSVLIIDDDNVALRVTQRLLEKEGFEVTGTSSGEDGLEIMTMEQPDLVLLDLHMPGMDGFDVIRKMKEDPVLSDVPVIFLTADEDNATEAKLFDEGAMDFIKKPFPLEAAIHRINRIIEWKYLKDSLQSEVENKTAKLRESNRKIRSLSRHVIYALSVAIDAKDKYTNGHSNRVAEYSMELARRMGKPSEELEEIYDTALLHDVGKIAIPNEIINKPGKLDDHEFEIIKSHPVKGYEILKSIPEMPSLSIGAHWHHERYDGRGYPDGLKGEEIPEIARIIGVADSYDAMTSNRSYRDLLPQHVVRSEIEKGKGTQFDPVIADIMLQMIDKDVRYEMREI